jgi:hypothetical protein
MPVSKEIRPYKIYFEVESKLDILISTTKIYWNVITHIKHPTIKGKEADVKRVLCDPDEIRVSKKDRAVLLFYRRSEKRYLCVVVRFFKRRGFIITAYWTKKIKEGELRWKR